MIGPLYSTVRYHDISLSGDIIIHAISCGDPSLPTLLLLHGYGGFSALFFKILPELAKIYHVVCIDLPGLGCSSRPNFPFSDVESTIAFFIASIARVTEHLDFPKVFTIGGHSLGGYLASCYAINHPERINALVLMSPAGITAEDPMTEEEIEALKTKSNWKVGLFWKTVHYCFRNEISPFDIARKLGFVGRWLVAKAVNARFGGHLQPQECELISDFIIESVNLPAGFEKCIFRFFQIGATPRKPLEHLLEKAKIPSLFLYGQHDWMDSAGACRLASLPRASTQIVFVAGAGHQLILENPEGLTSQVKKFARNLPHLGQGRKEMEVESRKMLIESEALVLSD